VKAISFDYFKGDKETSFQYLRCSKLLMNGVLRVSLQILEKACTGEFFKYEFSISLSKA
jgi:hypothetical protein